MIPRYQYAFDDALAEKTVLGFAHEHHFQFGKDLVFSYGPLGFLITRYFLPGGQGLKLAALILLCFTVALGIRLVGQRLVWGLKYGLWGIFLFVICNLELRADLVVYIGLFSWAMLSLVLETWKLYCALLVLAVLCAFAVLVKVNFLVVGGVTCGAVALDLVCRKQWKQSVFLPIALVTSFVIGWLLCDQRLQNLRSFFENFYWVVKGYDQTIGLEGLSTLKTRGFIALFLALLFILLRSLRLAGSRSRIVLVAAWCSLLTWLIWKHSFVRADFFHMGFFFGFAALLPFLLRALPALDNPIKVWERLAGIVCCLFPVYTLQAFCFPELPVSVTMPFRLARQNVEDLAQPRSYLDSRLKEFNAAKHEASLREIRRKVAEATIDVFGQNQTFAIFNDLNYHPRPVFQSYEAYNRQLMEINERFYYTRAAPEYVLFDLSPIDHKFPPLEDALVFRDLIFNYSWIDHEKNFLLLSQQSEAQPVLTLLQAGEIPVDGKIPLEDFGTTNLWLEISVQPTPRGRVRQFLYKLPKPRIRVWLEGKAKPLPFPAPAPMLAAGFLASPLLLHNEDVERYYRTGQAMRPAAYGVEFLPEDIGYWETRMNFRLYKIAGSGQDFIPGRPVEKLAR
jgi:hypothetical protein